MNNLWKSIQKCYCSPNWWLLTILALIIVTGFSLNGINVPLWMCFVIGGLVGWISNRMDG